MCNDIVSGLFEIFKSQYGITVSRPASVFDGQRDMLEFLMGVGRDLERMFFAELGSGYAGTKVVIGGEEYRFKGNRRRVVHGLFGKVELKRAYYVGSAGRTYYPLDEQLSLKGHTPGLQYFLALFTGQNVYQKSLDHFHKIFRPEGEDEISMRKCLDMDYELGEALEELRQKEIEKVVEDDESIESRASIDGLMAVSIDATKVRHKLGEKVIKGGRKR